MFLPCKDCCDDEPPPHCFCGDFCQYFIEVLTPSGVATKSLEIGCLPTGIPQETVALADAEIWPWDGVEIPPPFGIETVDCISYIGFTAPCDRKSVGYTNVSLAGLSAQAGVSKCYVPPPCGLPVLSIEAFATVRFSCSEPYAPAYLDPFIEVALNVIVRKVYQRFSGPPEGPTSNYSTYKAVRINPHTRCDRSDSLLCIPYPSKKVIVTPLVIAVDPDGALFSNPLETFRGEFPTSGVSTGYGPEEEECATIANQVAAAFAASFRITARTSCKHADCDCEISPVGLRFQMGGDSFVLSEDSDVFGFSAYEFFRRYTYDTYGASGFQVTYEKWDEHFLNAYERITVQVFCGAESLSSSTKRWYVAIVSQCFEYNEAGTITAQYFKQHMGQFRCSPATYNTDHHVIGDAIPLGDVVDLVLTNEGGTPGYATCTPPAIPTITLSEL